MRAKVELVETGEAGARAEARDHRCLIYRDEEEQAAAVAPYFADGLAKGERCIYVAARRGGEAGVFARLQRLGVDVAGARASGALLVVGADDARLGDGRGGPEDVVRAVHAAAAKADARGFAGVRIAGEMEWALAGEPGCARLAEYEARLDREFPRLRASVICLYDARRFPPGVLKRAIETHPLVVYGGLVCPNAYYVPAEELASDDLEARQVERLLSNVLERERAQQEVRELQARLEERVAERTRQLAAANSDLESFAYTVSHDLRAPLRSIAFYADILVEDVGESLAHDARSHLEQVAAEARRASRLVDDILALSRPAEGAPAGTLVDLSALVQQLTRELGAANPGRTVVTRTQPHVLARGEPALLRAALYNLLSNAWKYTPREDAAVAFGARRVGAEWECYVRDNGVGFDMAKAARLFQPFERLHGSGFEGSGVGLATVKRIVTRHGGRIWAESAPGEGTTVRFTLPAA